MLSYTFLYIEPACQSFKIVEYKCWYNVCIFIVNYVASAEGASEILINIHKIDIKGFWNRCDWYKYLSEY